MRVCANARLARAHERNKCERAPTIFVLVKIEKRKGIAVIIRVHYVHSEEVAITSGICESSLSVQAYGSRLYLFWRRSHFGASFIIG